MSPRHNAELYLHGEQLGWAVQQALHAAVQLPVVVRLDVEHEIGVGHTHVPLEGQVKRPACVHYHTT